MPNKNFSSPAAQQMRYSNLHCSNLEWSNRTRCKNYPNHRQLHIWKNAAVPLLLDQVEQGTLTVRTRGTAYTPGGCGPLWSAAADLSELDAHGALQNLSGSQVARLVGEDRPGDRYPLRGLEVLRLLDNVDGTGVEIWTCAIDRDDQRRPTRLRDLFDSTMRGSGWAMRQFERAPVRVPIGLDI